MVDSISSALQNNLKFIDNNFSIDLVNKNNNIKNYDIIIENLLGCSN